MDCRPPWKAESWPTTRPTGSESPPRVSWLRLKVFLISSQRALSGGVSALKSSLNLRRFASAPVVSVWDSPR